MRPRRSDTMSTFGARRPKGAHRNGQLDLLEPVRGEHRDPAAREGRLLNMSTSWLGPNPYPSTADTRAPCPDPDGSRRSHRGGA